MMKGSSTGMRHRSCAQLLLVAVYTSWCPCLIAANQEVFGGSLGLHPRNLLLSEGLLARASHGARVQAQSCMEVWREAFSPERHLGRMAGIGPVVSRAAQQVAAFGVSSFGSSLIHNLHQLQLPLLSPASPSSALAPQSSEELALLNQRLHTRLNTVMQPEGWETVLRKDNVEVSRKRVTGLYMGGEKFDCVRATGVVRAEPKVVFEILRDSRRVDEYNKECAATRDLARLADDTKLMWACSKTYFPFKPRDFVTRVHSAQLPDGSYVIASESPENFVPSPQDGPYVRTNVLLSGSVMRPLKGNPNYTEFITLGHINPGGAADTPLGAQLANKICIYGPVAFIRRLEAAAQKTPALVPC
mmetsp:Transcript_39358/g.93118  ORF Transcript_39358/g.93118 Transcript_39358/m.93118 type:complete len:359 (+) Transcript_39358:433-1509(+)